MPFPPLDHLDLSAQGYFFFSSIAAPIATPKDRPIPAPIAKLSNITPYAAPNHNPKDIP